MQYWGVCDKIHSFGVKPYIVRWPYTQRFIIMQSWFCNFYVVLRTNTCNKLCKVFSNVKQFSENYCVGTVMLSNHRCSGYVIYTIKCLLISRNWLTLGMGWGCVRNSMMSCRKRIRNLVESFIFIFLWFSGTVFGWLKYIFFIYRFISIVTVKASMMM